MAHYAFLDENDVVTEVIVGKNEGNFDWEQQYGSFRGQACKRTSYNTRGGIYYDPETNEPSADQTKAFRKNYAGIGYIYDNKLDAFIPPKPFASWLLNETTCLWNAPVALPSDGGRYTWDEATLSWVSNDTV
jgi:hypothetical protein